MVMGSVQWGENRYPMLWVYEEGEYWAFCLHRLVAYAHGKIDHIRFESGEYEVDHLDEDKWNNVPENLDPKTPEAHGRRHQ